MADRSYPRDYKCEIDAIYTAVREKWPGCPLPDLLSDTLRSLVTDLVKVGFACLYHVMGSSEFVIRLYPERVSLLPDGSMQYSTGTGLVGFVSGDRFLLVRSDW